MKNNKLSVSPGNSKLGAIPSVSLPPVITCPAGVPCAKKCYAVKLQQIRKVVRAAYARNYDILKSDPACYWAQLRAAAMVSRYFRFHVSGDIPNGEYFAEMVKTAETIPGTEFLAFTKCYNVVNAFIDNGGVIPKNLHIIFSKWEDGGSWTVPNPHKLPESTVIFKGQEPRQEWKVCGGNCTECACRGVGCWELRAGETIAFYER